MSTHATERDPKRESSSSSTDAPVTSGPGSSSPSLGSDVVPLPVHATTPATSTGATTVAPAPSPLERLRPSDGSSSPESAPTRLPAATTLPSASSSADLTPAARGGSALTGHWVDGWGRAIDSYLAAEMRTHAELMSSASYPALRQLLPALAASLRDPEAHSSEARAILEQILRAVVNKNPKVEKQIAALEKSPKPGAAEKAASLRAAMPTAFPTFSSNVWLEYINAKALWIRNQAEDRELLPGDKPEGNDEGKPDYKTPRDGGGQAAAQVLGDHIGVKLGDTPDQVAARVSSAILTKVEKYKPSRMRVVVDVTRAPAKQALWETADHGKAEIVMLLNAAMSADTNFWSASIVFDDTAILDIQRADCTPAKPALVPAPSAPTTSASTAAPEPKDGESKA